MIPRQNVDHAAVGQMQGERFVGLCESDLFDLFRLHSELLSGSLQTRGWKVAVNPQTFFPKSFRLLRVQV
jgi:hypothetical protein